jgi:cytochrome c-type biogenesis protein CcmH/NrfG
VKNHPDNAEAYIHLAEAYRATGQKDKALASLEKCKTVVKDSPEAVKQVEQIITSIKNS